MHGMCSISKKKTRQVALKLTDGFLKRLQKQQNLRTI